MVSSLGLDASVGQALLLLALVIGGVSRGEAELADDEALHRDLLATTLTRFLITFGLEAWYCIR